MRDLGILVGLLALAGVVGFFLWKGLPNTSGMKVRLPPDAMVDTGKTKSEDKTPAKGAAPGTVLPRRQADLRKRRAAEEAAPATSQEDPVQPPALPMAPPPFPTSGEIALGAGRAEVLEEFGRPNVKASAVERGRLLETFVYVHASQSTSTWVRFRNAKVVRVDTY